MQVLSNNLFFFFIARKKEGSPFENSISQKNIEISRPNAVTNFFFSFLLFYSFNFSLDLVEFAHFNWEHNRFFRSHPLVFYFFLFFFCKRTRKRKTTTIVKSNKINNLSFSFYFSFSFNFFDYSKKKKTQIYYPQKEGKTTTSQKIAMNCQL